MKIYPVVHIESVGQAVEQADVAFEKGADGIYLIDHNRGVQDVDVMFRALNILKYENSDHYIGVNILGAGSLHAAGIVARSVNSGEYHAPNALWVDDIRSGWYGYDRPEQTREELQTIHTGLVPRLLGGVAFKGTSTYTDDPVEARAETNALKSVVDVVTTSGRGTGMAPPVEKIFAMKVELGNQPLAVASGLSIENIAQYRGLIDEVLAATYLETVKGSGIFDKKKLEDFIQAGHSL